MKRLERPHHHTQQNITEEKKRNSIVCPVPSCPLTVGGVVLPPLMPVSIERGLGGVAGVDTPNKKESKIIFQNIKKDFPIYRGVSIFLKVQKNYFFLKREILNASANFKQMQF